MANDEHVAMLRQGVGVWNEWRRQNLVLSEEDLRQVESLGARVRDLDARVRDLGEADLSRAELSRAELSRVNLSGANLGGANLYEADLSGANLSGAALSRTNLSVADLSGADLRGAILTAATLIDTDFSGADLTGCFVYGVSAWNLKLDRAKQQNLIITNGRVRRLAPAWSRGASPRSPLITLRSRSSSTSCFITRKSVT